MATLEQLLAIVTPVLISVSIGVVWARRALPFDEDVVRTLISTVGMPCLILVTFSKVDLGVAALAEIAGAGLVVYVVFGLLGAVVLRAVRLPVRSYLPALVFPMIGTLGLPVCLLAFGERGLALALVFFAIGMAGSAIVEEALASRRVSFSKLARTPVLCAVVLAIGLELAQADLPRWALNTSALLGALVIPIQLVALGFSLARVRVAHIGRSVAFALVRLGAGAAVGWAVATVFGLGHVAAAVVILLSAMPIAVASHFSVQTHHRAPQDVAGMALISASASIITLPALLILLI